MPFLADAMLGKLARWLRIMGYDTLYHPSLDDTPQIELARKEGRTLLTRDEELYRRAIRDGVMAVLIKSLSITKELEELSNNLMREERLDPDSRCPICNGLLADVERTTIKSEKVPEGRKVWKCTSCGKIYWHGSHWKGINKTLNDLGLVGCNDHP